MRNTETRRLELNDTCQNQKKLAAIHSTKMSATLFFKKPNFVWKIKTSFLVEKSEGKLKQILLLIDDFV